VKASKGRRMTLVAVVGAVVVAVTATGFWMAADAADAQSLFKTSDAPTVQAVADDAQSVEVGVRFTADRRGTVNAIRFFKGAGNDGTHTAHLWGPDGALLASATFTGESAGGWQSVNLSAPVAVRKGATYTASYTATRGHYPDDENFFGGAYRAGSLTVAARGGVYRYGSGYPTVTWHASNYWVDIVFTPGGRSTPLAPSHGTATMIAQPPADTIPTTPTGPPPTTTAPSTRAPSSPASSSTPPAAAGACSGAAGTPGGPDSFGGCWPGPDNTGAPAALKNALTNYSGTCTIRQDNTVIDGKNINCDGIANYARNVVIRNSVVRSTILNQTDAASLTVENSTIDGGDAYMGTLMGPNITVLGSNISGGEHVVHCSSNCRVENSWLHDPFDGSKLGWHQNGFLSNGGSNFTITHSSVSCRGGCTAAISLLNDGSLANAQVSRNLLVASPDASFCAYPFGSVSKNGGRTNLVWTDNVFQKGNNGKCATYGPVYEFNSSSGNRWSGNRWVDGTPITG
jgi:Domain of unknown function (DUF4082)